MSIQNKELMGLVSSPFLPSDEGEVYYPDLIPEERDLGVQVTEAVIAAESLQAMFDRRYRPVQPTRMASGF